MQISLKSIQQSISIFFGRYHFIILIVFLVCSASYTVLLINETVGLSDDANGYTSQENSTRFDEETIKRLRSLKDSDQQTEKLPVSGRVSPF
jgi:hypothetical protein